LPNEIVRGAKVVDGAAKAGATAVGADAMPAGMPASIDSLESLRGERPTKRETFGWTVLPKRSEAGFSITTAGAGGGSITLACAARPHLK